MRIAVVHEWLTQWAGSEAVLEQILVCFPDADLFALTSKPDNDGRLHLKGRAIKTSFIQKLPFGSRWPQAYLPWLPLAVEMLNLRSYDLVISNSHCVAKGVITSPDTLHLSYVHTPARYAWDMQNEYLQRVPPLLRPLWAKQMHRLRLWDAVSAKRPSEIACNSSYISRRIQRAWGRDARVIYPPVDVSAFTPSPLREDYYVTASRLVGYKRVCLIAEAFVTMPEKTLKIVGDGPERNRIAAIASKARNIEILGHLPRIDLIKTIQKARAFIFAAEEDFGIAPVEAMACGIPVIAFGRGGASESVVNGTTGLLFYEQTVSALSAAINDFEQNIKISPTDCRERALSFSPERFRSDFIEFVTHALKASGQGSSLNTSE